MKISASVIFSLAASAAFASTATATCTTWYYQKTDGSGDNDQKYVVMGFDHNDGTW